MTNAIEAIKALVRYGIEHELIHKTDARWAANGLLDIMKIEPDSSFTWQGGEEMELEDILAVLLDDAVSRGLIDSGIASRDLFDTRLMGVLTPRPSEVIRTFKDLYRESPKEATDYFYKLSLDSDYIRTYRIRRDRKWTAETPYGILDITINLSKPEKDPKAIAAALAKKSDAYPKCALCPENEGYAGRLDHPARENIRLIPLKLDGTQWYLQYSPYVYYNEHCIILSENHSPMVIDKATFRRLLEFVQKYPHYIVGSNADLPIVGGSILTHEHFQGGRYDFAMAKAPIKKSAVFAGYEDVEAGIVNWPMSVIRLSSLSVNRLVDLADDILQAWIGYSDEDCAILSHTDGVRHNTITPIARMRGGRYELDLVLRNNRTSEEHPLGIFHPHAQYHHIKKENIGLIEVMGLAILPARLLNEMAVLNKALVNNEDLSAIESIASHREWAEELKAKYGTFENEEKTDQILKEEIGHVFAHVLEDCGVFKDTEEGTAHFLQFIASVK
ncbi:MAG: UDP-glucose--hexose-1-phosphate uridylyltransferase [Solobacterium sp.]|nr:UDP-glucose--hexose-1-phosphate uridylyltransferase [Solobacterium sp.]